MPDDLSSGPAGSPDAVSAHDHDLRFWDRQAATEGRWSRPVDAATIEQARAGIWTIGLTPVRRVPDPWLRPIEGLDVLGLASAGGQQRAILAAAGARVVAFDASEGQLEKDAMLSARYGLPLTTVRGDMRDLSAFADSSFDVIFHPCANMYIDEVRVVWRECHRVLRSGGRLLSGFNNPMVYIFDWESHERGDLVVRHPLPFADDRDLPAQERQSYIERGVALEYSHTLDDQIGGQIEAGFEITGFYEDRQPSLAASQYIRTAFATLARARK